MIKIKHLLDPVEPDDGQRISVEPFSLTRDLREWCKVDEVLTHLAPPMKLWEWFEEHPDGYDYFRAQYHDALATGAYKSLLQQIAGAGLRETYTLLHQGDDPGHNSATALHEFLTELEAWTPREE